MIDLAKVVIWAEDKTKEGAESAQKNLQGVHNEVESLKSKWAALGGLLGITAFAMLVKGAIDAQAKIKDLAIEAGMTVEQLTRFEEIGRTSGEGLEGITTAVGKLSKSLMEAKDPTSAQAQALKAINLSWAELKGLSPDEQLIKIARAQAQFGPSLEKNAAMMALFAKGGAKFQVALEEIAGAQKLAATTSQNQADAADAFNDSLASLGLRFAKFGRQIANEVLEYLNPLIKAMTELPEKSYSTIGVVDILAGTLKYLGGIVLSVWLALQDMGDALGATAAKVVAFFSGDWNGIAAINKAREEQARKNEETYNRMWDRLKGNLKEEIALTKERDRVSFNPGAGKIRDEELKQYEAASLELAKQIALWRERERLGRSLTEAEKMLSEIEAGKYAKLTPLHQAELKRKTELFDVEQKRVLAAKADLEARLKEAGALGKSLEALNEKVEAAKIENDTFGLTKAQIELVTIARLEERRAQLLGIEGTELQVKALDLEIAKRRELVAEYGRGDRLEMLRREQELEAQIWEEGASRASNFFVDLVTNGRKAFRSLGEEVKAFGREMVAVFLKRWILSLGASMTGNPALAQLAGSTGQGSLAGTAIDWAGSAAASYFGYAGLGTAGQFFGAVTGSIPAGAIGSQAVAAGVGVDTMAAGAGSAIYEALAAIGPYGWIAIAVIAVAAWFSGRGGGPKPGGSFMGGFDAAGSFTGPQAVPGTDNGRFFTPSQGDAAMESFTMDFARGFYRTLAGLGGTTEGLQFGFGFDSDPSGTAENRVSAMVRGADGRVLFSNTQTAGRDDEDFNRAIALQTRRAILAGLQGSDLPEAIASILSGVAAETATTEQIDQVFALAGAMRSLLDVLTPLSVEDLVAEAGRSAIDAWRAQGEQLLELANNTDLSVESLNRLTQATGQYRAAAAQLILQFEAARTSVAAGITETLRDMLFQTLDQQGQYDMLRSESSALLEGLGGMQDAGQIVAAVNSIRALSTQAFGMLSEEERRAMLPQFQAGLLEAQRQADERLAALRDEVREEANAQLARQETVANGMAKAAMQMDVAADKFLLAVDRFESAEIPVRITAFDGGIEVKPG